MTKIIFLPANITTENPAGSSLLEAARNAGVFVETPCGGKGTCQKCLVKIKKTSGQKSDNKEQSALICQTVVPDEPITVELHNSLTGAEGKFENFEDPSKYLNVSGDMSATASGAKFLKKITLQVAAPAPLDGLSDYDRFSKAFLKALDCKSEVDYKSAELPLNILSGLPEMLREKNGQIIVHFYTENNIAKAVDITVSSASPAYGIAVDVGTTTVALWLVDLETNKVVSSRNAYNNQIECGFDVISRINYAKKFPTELRTRILKTINDLIFLVCKDAGVESSKILCVSIAGNTTMIHLLLGIIPEYIRLSPYTPAVFKPQVYSASQTGFNICENAPVLIAPAVGSYVGGDITAGLLCTKLAQDSGKNKNELVLFIDIGTNGEIALGNNDFIFACACSAGPAFEGGGIKHGVRAQTGAIERVVINENKKAEIQTIGGAPPIGICGSGIISVVAELFKNGIVDSAGKFPERNDEYILYEDASSGSRITISENDIGNFIRAKGAIFSACQTLLGSAGMSFDNVDKIYVAGGFGRFLDLDDARAVGLLPKFLNEKYVFLGNSSVIGAYLSLVSEERRSRMHELAEKITYMDLSSEPAYMDYYTGALFLPHTDKRLFE